MLVSSTIKKVDKSIVIGQFLQEDPAEQKNTKTKVHKNIIAAVGGSSLLVIDFEGFSADIDPRS